MRQASEYPRRGDPFRLGQVKRRFALCLAGCLVAPSVAAHGPKLASAAERRLPNGRRMGRPAQEMPLVFFGLRATETRVSGDDVFPGLTLASHSLDYFHDRSAHVNGRVGHFGFIGLERNGVEGGFGADFTVGLFAPLAKTEGLVSRLGFRGHLLGNHEFYTSLVELPMLELGYQRIDREFGFDVAARGGAVLVGRFNPDDERRRLGGSFEYGGVLAFHVHAIDFNLDWARIEARSSEPGTPVDMLRGLVCGGARFFGVCMDTRWSSGEVNSSGERKSITYLGLAVGGLGRWTPTGVDMARTGSACEWPHLVKGDGRHRTARGFRSGWRCNLRSCCIPGSYDRRGLTVENRNARTQG